MKRLKIVKGRFPNYHWIGGEPNRKMARDILNAMQLYANNDLVKVEAKPKAKSTPYGIRKKTNKMRLIDAFESGATSVTDACEIANVSRKVFYDYLKTDSEFQMAINIAAIVKRKATPQCEIPTKPQPKPKAQQKPRTISMFWGLIKINY
jgi:predicted transcriptional regulator